MLDRRNNLIKDGDLCLRGIKDSSPYLEYVLVIREKLFWLAYIGTISTSQALRTNNFVVIDSLNNDEKELKKEILKRIIDSKTKKINDEDRKTAKRLLNLI